MPIPTSPQYSMNPFSAIRQGAQTFVQAIIAYAPTVLLSLEGVLAHFTPVTLRVWLNTYVRTAYQTTTQLGNICFLFACYGPKTSGAGSVPETCSFNSWEMIDQDVHPVNGFGVLQAGMAALAFAPSDTGAITIFRQATGVDAGLWQVTFTP